MNPRSLQNLELGKWPKGESGNPNGRPSAGMSVREWMNQMQDWPESKLQATTEDLSAPACQRTAARVWLAALRENEDLNIIFDRTLGRPSQSVDVTSNGESVNLTPIVLDGDREV